jgi:hypothetical protein
MILLSNVEIRVTLLRWSGNGYVEIGVKKAPTVVRNGYVEMGVEKAPKR